MSEEFSRTELMFGKEAVKKLKESTVCVFGLGGVGGHLAEALARAGVGTLYLADNDIVSLSDLNRQLISTRNTLGMSKTQAAKERILSVMPTCKVITSDCFFLPENCDEFDFTSYDYVVDAVDTVTAKLAIIMAAKEAGVPVISSMGAGNKLNPAQFEVADIYKTSVCPLAKVMRHELKKRGIKDLKVVYSKEEPIKRSNSEATFTERKIAPASIAFVPSVAGLIIASEVVKDIAKGRL